MTDRAKRLRILSPLLTVLIAGVTGLYLVYDNYFVDRSMAAQVAGIEPAGGAVQSSQ